MAIFAIVILFVAFFLILDAYNDKNGTFYVTVMDIDKEAKLMKVRMANGDTRILNCAKCTDYPKVYQTVNIRIKFDYFEGIVR